MTSPLKDLATAHQIGPWIPNLNPAERLARLQGLRAMVQYLAGPRGATLVGLLRQAETDEAALLASADALHALTPVEMRRALLSYASLARPLPLPRRHSTAVYA